MIQDLATQVWHWDYFQTSCKQQGVKPGRFVSPIVGEFLSGPALIISPAVKQDDMPMIQLTNVAEDCRKIGPKILLTQSP